jgi:hypothetical protein
VTAYELKGQAEQALERQRRARAAAVNGAELLNRAGGSGSGAAMMAVAAATAASVNDSPSC